MVRSIMSNQQVVIPETVDVTIKARTVRVKGPRGTLTRSFKHLNIDIRLSGPKEITVEKWFGNKRELAAVRTVCTHITNMFTGVIKGYEYKLKLVYAHFPINATVSDDKKTIEVRNFIGEKVVRKVRMPAGVTIDRTSAKDEVAITGNSLEDVSVSAAQVQQCAMVRKKDIRKFLDGLYVSERNVIGEDPNPVV
jgi:large subunit ribosomal protein L9e